MVESGPSSDEDEIDLLELIRTLLQAWKTIVGITIICTGLAVAYALYTPEVFKAETLLAPAQEEKSGASSALSQFGGLAAMAGISIPSKKFRFGQNRGRKKLAEGHFRHPAWIFVKSGQKFRFRCFFFS